MPQKVRLPDGTVVEIPDDISPEDRRRFIAGVNAKFGVGTSQAPPAFENPYLTGAWLRGGDEEAETGIASLREPPPVEGGNILGSAWEGIKSIPRGARQFGLMALRGAEGLRTPDEDTAREKELRRKLQSLMEEIDPKYRDANLAQLGLGLGQMGAMVATSFIPIIGKPLAFVGAGAMGAGEQAERMFEYEERTGEDISSDKEKWALAAGLGIGFTEMVPLGKFAPKVNVFGKGAKQKMLQEAAVETGDRWQDVARDIVSTSITQGMEEAAQEAGAGFLQSATGKFLYDDEAMADAGVTALKEGLIGGEVGAVGNALLRLATRGGRAARLRSGWAVRADSELARMGREEAEKLSPEELERKFGAFLTSQTPDAIEMREGILDDTTLARVERRYAERIEQIKEQTEDGSADQSRQMEVANSDLAVAKQDISNRKSAIEKYRRGELRETDEDEVPERAEVINAGEVVNRAQEAQLTEEDAAVIGASNVSGSPPQPTFNIHDILDQVHLRLRPTKTELETSERVSISESLVESERSLSRQRGLIRRLQQKLKDIPKNVEAQTARRNEINLELEEAQAIDPSLTEAQFLELNPDYAEELVEINGVIENAEGDFAKTQQKITTAEASVTKLDGEIKSGRDPAVVEERVTEAVETFERGEDDVLDVEGRLLTQTQRDNLRLLWGRAKQVVSENGTPVAMPPGATTAQAVGLGHTIVNQDVQLTAREARDIVSGIFDGGLAQGVRVGWETSRGRQRTAPDWTADISEGDVPTTYQVTEPGKQTLEEGDEISLEIYDAAKAADPTFFAERVVRATPIESKPTRGMKAKEAKLQTEVNEARQERDTGREAQQKILNDAGISREVYGQSFIGGTQDTDFPEIASEMGRTADEISKGQQRLSVAEDALRRFKSTQSQSLSLREEAAIRERPELDEGLITGRRAFVDNTKRMEKGTQATPEETRSSRLVSESILSKVLGFRSIIDMSEQQDSWQRDDPTDLNFEELADHIRDPDVEAVWSKFKANDAVLTKEIAEEAMGAKNIEMDVDEFVADTLGKDLADVNWQDMTAGEGQLVMSRIIRTNIQQVEGKSYVTPSTVPAAAGLQILDFFTQKTAKGKYKGWALGTQAKPSNNIKRLKNTTGLSTDQVLDYIDRSLTAGVLTKVKGKVQMATPEQFAATIDERRTAKARETAKIKEELELNGTLRSIEQLDSDAVKLQRARKIMSAFKASVVSRLKKMGHPEAAIRVGIAADSVYAKVKEIVEDPDIVVQSRLYKDGADASIQDHGTMVLFNLSDMQLSHPQKVEEGESDTAYAQRLAKETAFHEGAHLYFIRDDLPIADRNSLDRYGRRQHVPESVNPDNTGPNKLTWRQWVESTYPEYNEAQITEETSVRILDALAKGQISKPKSAGFLTRIKKELEARGRALVGANAEVDISDVMKIFKRLQSGEYDRRKEAVKKRVTGISSAQLLERATAEELQDLKAAAGQGEAALERAARDIVTRVDPDYKPVSLTDSMLDDIRARREIEDTGDFILPIINQAAIEAGDISVAALNEYFAFTDKSKAPPRFLDGTRHMSRHGNRPSERGPGAQRVAETHGDTPREVSPGQDFIEAPFSHELIAGRETDEYAESPADFEESMRYTTGELFRLKFVDKRLSQWKSHLRATREQAMNTLAQVSAIAAWRMHDSALNFLPGILKYGMLSYTNGGFKLDKLYAVDPATNEYRRDSSGDKIPVKGLREILRPILKLGKEMQSDTKNYVVSKRILDVHDRLEQAKQSGDKEQVKKWQAKYDRLNPKKDKKHKYPLDQAQDIINRVDAEAEAGDVDSRAVLQFVQEYADFNYHVIEFAYHSGLLALDRKLEMQSLSYVPFYKDQGWAQSQPLEGTNNKHYQKGSPIIDKAIEGSWDDIKDDLLGMIVSNVQAITRDGMWNVATQRTMRDEIKNGTAEEVDDYLDPRLEGKAKKLRQEEIKQKEKELDDKLLSDVVVRFKVDGVERKFRVKDPLLVQSIMSVGFSPSQAIEDFFGKVIPNERVRKGLTTLVISPARILRETVTRSPPFIIKNIIRDSWQASVTFGGGPQLLFKSIKYALDPDTLRRAEMHGLGIGVDWSPDPVTASAYEMRQMKWDQKSWADPIKFATIPWAALGQMSRQSEVATRMAIFDKVMETTDGDAAEAAYQATEIMNYGRRGSSQFFSILTTMAPFMNGRIQGLDVVYRTHIGAADAPGLYDGADDAMLGALTTEQRQKHRAARIATAFSRGSLLAMGTLLYYYWVKDEEEYKNAREDQKNDWWLIPIGKRAGIKIPIPFEVGTLYKVIPEQIARAIYEEEHDLRDVRDETLRQIKATLMLDLRPQFIRPMIDAVRNEDVFQRDAIVPQWMEDTVAATEQKNAYTNRMAVMLADALDNVPLVKNLDFLTSPMKLEYMARQYVGTLGAYAMVAADRVVREGWLGTEEMNIVGTSADFGFAADTWVNIPALGDLFYNPRKGGGYQEDFYEVYEEMNKLVSTLGQLEEGRGRKEAQEFKEEHKELFDAKRRLQYFERRMKHYRTERDRLFERSDLSDDDKRRQLFRMFETRDDMLGEMVKIMADIRDERSIMEAALGTRP